MKLPPCRSEDEVARSLRDGGDEASRAHLAACPTCRATHERLRHAVALAKGLPANLPDAARREEVRAELLALAAARPLAARSRVPWLVVAIAPAAMLLLWLWHARDAREAARSHVDVRPGVGARYTIASPPPSEIVRLWEGQIDLDVRPLGPGQRVRVVVGDAEVEVRGTRFQVTASADRLTAVDVTHGRVEVRPKGALAFVLGAGQTWRTPIASAPKLPLAQESPPVEAPAPTRRSAAGTKLAVARALRPTRQESLYDDAWDALRARRYADAAAGFERVLADAPSGPLADEAAFWKATALARGGARSDAIAAFRRFLGTYERSPRRAEASAILGWLLVDAQRPEEAAVFFKAAANDSREAVRVSAREGLETIERASTRH